MSNYFIHFASRLFWKHLTLTFSFISLFKIKDTGGESRAKRYKAGPPRKFFKKLINKNVTKPKNRAFPLEFLIKSWTPYNLFLENNIMDPVPWIFQPCASMSAMQTRKNKNILRPTASDNTHCKRHKWAKTKINVCETHKKRTRPLLFFFFQSSVDLILSLITDEII